MTDDGFMPRQRGGGNGLQRGRGGFVRNADDTPFVTDPSGETVKSGPRKGLPKRLPYGQPSGRGRQIENDFALSKWTQREIVRGVGIDETLRVMCVDVAALDPDTSEYRELADKVVARAQIAAESMLSANRGSHVHLIVQIDDEGGDWRLRADEGVALGISEDAQAALVAAWRAMRVDADIEVLVSEASCVDDAWHLAGTLDNVVRLRRALTFRMPTAELRTIPAGTISVLDKKTGSRRVDRNGAVMYWHGYAIQIASYAQSVYYDTEREMRAAWPWAIDQQHALIAHLDVVAAIAGDTEGLCELVYVDLVAGREDGGVLANAAKAWERRSDLFSVAQVAVDDVEGQPLSVVEPLSTDPDSVTGVSQSAGSETQPLSLPMFSGRRDWLRERCRSLAAHSAVGAAAMAQRWGDMPALSDDAHDFTTDELDDIEALIETAEAIYSAPFVTGDPRISSSGPRTAVNEGHDVDSTAIAQLAAAIASLSATDVSRCKRFAAQAAEAGASISLSERQSIRRWEIARALFHFHNGTWDDALVRAVLDDMTDVERGRPIGHYLAALDDRCATELADVASAYAAGTLIATVQPNGSTCWTDGGQHIYTAQCAA